MSSLVGQSPGIGLSSRPSSRVENRLDTRLSSRPSSPPSSRASTRPSSAAPIFTPTDDAESHRTRPPSRQSLRDSGPASPGSGKRKRDGSVTTSDDLLKSTIVLKPHPSSLTVKPRILHPLMLLPRESLPLSSLDLSQPLGDFPASRLFESRIKILELEGRLGSNVLLARSETTRMVYALERESRGLYVLCKLGSWVDVEALGQSATVVCAERMRTSKPAKPGNPVDTPLTTPSMYNETKRRRLAIQELQSLVRKRSMSVIGKEDSPGQASGAIEERPPSRQDASRRNTIVQEPAGPAPDARPPTPAQHEAGAPDPATIDDPLSQPTAEDIFQNLRAQYLEALYHSKGSLAYFAKGPLSRARAAFHIDWDSNLDMNDLVDFLRSLVMTTIVIDKKYRETIPEIVAKMKTITIDSESGAPKPRKRKAKKPKLGKDGLYPGEIDHIRRWWASHEPTSVVDDERTFTAAEIKYHISSLRRRETQLQMILILEILALEPVALARGAECQLPGMELQPDSREASQELSTKKINKHNLPVLLDVHADRLCIWQSTTLDEVKAVAESQVPKEGAAGEVPERASSDPLRDFCVDIIVPFFSARLPGPCDSLNRKLGGPVAQSPPKEKAAKPASAVKPKPGAPIKRAAPSKRDRARTLERALSVERSRRSVSQGPSAAIALLRNASQTVIPGLKREVSESSLMGLVPRARADSNSLKDRPSSMFTRSISLSGADLKAQKKAQVEAELKDAITALKKPNRTLAVKDFVEAADKRASAGQLKKLKKPNRASAVQVKATPANNRYRDVLAAEKAQSQPAPFLDIPPSSASVVPASTLPRKFANRLPANPSPPTPRVQATPVRQTSSIAAANPLHAVQDTPLQQDGVPLSSPIMARKAAPPPPRPALFAAAAAVAPAASKPRSRPLHLSVPSSAGRFGGGAAAAEVPTSPGVGTSTLFETPVAPRSAKDRVSVVDDTPIRSRLPLGVAGDGENRVGSVVGKGKEKERGSGGGGGAGGSSDDAEGGENGGGMSIYQRLGWDTTDLDDIDDLL